MNCIEFEAALEQAVERHEPLDPATLEHTNHCAGCRVVWEQHQRLDAAIVAWRFAAPPAGLVDSILAELAKPVASVDLDDQEFFVDVDVDANDEELVTDGTHSARRVSKFAPMNSVAGRSRSRGLAIASAAACLLVAVISLYQFSGKNGQEVVRRSPDRITRPMVADVAMDLPGTLTAVLSDLRTEYREMASETTSVAREIVKAIPRPVSVSVMPDTDEIQLHPNSNDMARIFSPIGSRVESAFGFLWQAVPTTL